MMNTLVEIEAAIDTLSAEQKEELLLFVAQRLRTERASLPAPRKFTREKIASWIAEDEEDMRRFRESDSRDDHNALGGNAGHPATEVNDQTPSPSVVQFPDFVARAKAIWGESPPGPSLSELVAFGRETLFP